MSHGDLAGKEYVIICGELLSKMNQVTFSKFISVRQFHYMPFSHSFVLFLTDNPNARDNVNGGMRFVVDSNDPINVGNCLKELRAMCHPEQHYVYCQMANKRGRYNLIKAGFPNVFFNKDVVVGKNTIAKFLPNLDNYKAIDNYKAKTPHVLRQWFITRLANSKTLNPTDVVKAARQKNFSSRD